MSAISVGLLIVLLCHGILGYNENKETIQEDESCVVYQKSYNEEEILESIHSERSYTSPEHELSYDEEELSSFLASGLRQCNTTDSLSATERYSERDSLCSDYDCDKSYTEHELDSLCSTASDNAQTTACYNVSNNNDSYNEDELSSLLAPGLLQYHTTDSLLDTERFGECSDYDCDKSYTEHELDSICSTTSDNAQTTASLNEQQISETFETFGKQFDCSTPLKNKRQADSSFNEEDWKTFLDQTTNEDEEMLPLDESDSDECDSESDSFNFTSIDPEFCGNVFAVPKSCSLSKGGIGVLPSRDSCLLNKALDKKSVLECKRTTGKCKCGCNCISLISARDIYNMRERFWTKSRHSQSQYLIHTMALKTVAGRYTFLTLDNGLKVCKKAFGSILKIDKKRFTSTKKLNGKDAKAAADKMPRSVTSTTISALAWLQTYAQERGDRMPHSTDVLLPYKTTKVAVYNTYRLDCGNRPCGRSQFFQLWKDHFPHLKIKEANSFSVCSKCAGIEKKLEQTLKPRHRRNLIEERQMHLERQKLERLYYYSKRDESRSDPEHYLSLIIDGMDQSKSSLPHFTGRQSKSINPADLLKTHITGVINHGQRRFETFIDYNQWPHDPNLTINILFLALQKSILTVNLSFLFVGHTHEDVDAAFSQISKRLRQQDVETYDDFIGFLPNAKDLPVMFDVKSWLEPHLCEPLSHTEPLHFRFQAINENDVKIHYKGLYNQPWIEYETGLFKSYENGKKFLPKGTPKLLPPNLDHINFDRLKRQIHVIKHMFSKSEHIEWWDAFLDKITEKQYSQKAQWYLNLLPRQKKEKETEHTEDTLPPEIRKQLDKETKIPHVRVVKKSTIVQKQKQTKCSELRKQGRSQKKNNKKNNNKTIRGRSRHSKGNRWKQLGQKQRQIVYYFITYTEEKNHIWFRILCDCVCNLVLAYGMLFIWIKLYQQLFMCCTVIDIDKLFIILEAFTQWLNIQMCCQAAVNIGFYLPDIFMPLTEEVRKTSLSPYRNKELCECQ